MGGPLQYSSHHVVLIRVRSLAFGGLRVDPNTASPRGQNFTLQPIDYIIGPASGNPNMCLTWPRASQPTPDGIDWQLGTFVTVPLRIYTYSISPPRLCIPPFRIHYLQASV